MLNPVLVKRSTQSQKIGITVLLVVLALSLGLAKTEKNLMASQFTNWESEVDSLVDEGNPEQAIKICEQAEQVAVAKKDWLAKAKFHGKRAFAMVFLGKLDESLRENDALIHFVDQYLPEQDSLIGHCYNRKAEIYLEKGERDSSIHFFNRAKAVYFQENIWYDYIYAQIGLANNFIAIDSLDQIESVLNDAALYNCEQELDDRFIEHLILIFKTFYYNRIGDYDKAIEFATHSLDYDFGELETLSSSDSLLLGDRYNNLGILYERKGELGSALDFELRALAMRGNLAEATLKQAITHANIALIYRKRLNFEKAIKHLEQGYDKLMDLGQPTSDLAKYYLNNYNIRAKCYIDQGRMEEALAYLNKAIEIGEPDKLYFLWSAYLNLGEWEFKNGQYPQAIAAFEKAITHLENKNKAIVFDIVKIKNWIGKSYLESGEIPSALQTFQEAIALLDENYDQSDIYASPKTPGAGKLQLVQVLEGKAAALRACYEQASCDRRDLDQVLTTYLQIDGLVTDLFKEYLSQEARQILLQLNKTIYEKAIHTALELYTLSKEEYYQSQAFTFTERSKSILLQERLRRSDNSEDQLIPGQYTQQSDSLKRDLAVYQKNLYLEKQKAKPDKHKTSVWEQKIFALKRGIEQLQTEVKKNYPNLEQEKYARADFKLLDFQQEQLQPDDLVLEYFIGDSCIYLFEISAQNADIQTIPKPIDLEERILGFKAQVEKEPASGKLRQTFNQFASDAHYFYQLLLADVLDRQTQRKLTIIPDEGLFSIPFELLLTEAATEKSSFYNAAYLLRDYSLNYAFSLRSLIAKDQGAGRWRGAFRCLAFAPSYPGEKQVALSGNISRLRGGNVALPDALEEVQAISDYFKGDFYFGPEASEHRFKSEAANYDLIHLAMHGEADEYNPSYSKLFFSEVPGSPEDNVLYAFEIQNWRLNADLVVLSACETGVGKFVQGEGVMSMASAFFEAGAPSVTMSLWRAQDKSTAMLMKHYYKNLAMGQEKDEALRQAKLAYLAHPMAQKHPFFWAAFVNIGDPAALQVRNNFQLWGFLLFGFLSILFVLWKTGLIKRTI